jgi:hypothetical protein
METILLLLTTSPPPLSAAMTNIYITKRHTYTNPIDSITAFKPSHDRNHTSTSPPKPSQIIAPP